MPHPCDLVDKNRCAVTFPQLQRHDSLLIEDVQSKAYLLLFKIIWMSCLIINLSTFYYHTALLVVDLIQVAPFCCHHLPGVRVSEFEGFCFLGKPIIPDIFQQMHRVIE